MKMKFTPVGSCISCVEIVESLEVVKIPTEMNFKIRHIDFETLYSP